MPIHTYRDSLTTDSAGDGSKTFKLGRRYLVGNLRGFATAARVEFFRIFFTVEEGGETVEGAGGGGGADGGGGGAGHATFRSPPRIVSGMIVEGNQILRVNIQGGTELASTLFHFAFDAEEITHGKR